MKMRMITVCAAALLTLGAATFAQAQDTTAAPPASQTEPAPPADAAPAAPAAEATAPAEAAPAVAPIAGTVEAPPAGKGQIVFFRPSRFVGGALTFTVRENDVDLGRLPNGRYFVLAVDPGIHSYEIGRNDTMRIEVEEGQTYWAMETTAMGVMAGRAVLSPSDQAAFQAALPHMRVSDPPH